jgi:hypothetical protein
LFFQYLSSFFFTEKACVGTDLNRNWGYHWGESGVSHNTCSDIYCGKGPFSEMESTNIKNYVEALSPVPVLGILFFIIKGHSFLNPCLATFLFGTIWGTYFPVIFKL